MTGGLTQFRENVVAQLQQEGVPAVAAFQPEERRRLTAPAAAVSLARVSCVPGSFHSYLGERDEEDGQSAQWYGREVELALALDVYAPRDGGESACRQTMEDMAELLLCQGAAGLSVNELESGQVEFLKEQGLYRLPVTCRCRGWLAAAVREDGVFTDFEIRGKQR